MNPKEAFGIAAHLVGALLTAKKYDGLLFYGQGGVGKTVTAMDTVSARLTPGQYYYQNGYSTPLALYMNLYENRKKKVVIFDDVEGMFSNKVSVSILKGALWPALGKRTVHYSTTSSLLDAAGIPYSFELDAKIIVLCNEIPNMTKPDMRALLGRMFTYEVSFTYKEKLELCKAFLEKENIKPVQKSQVLGLLTSMTSPATLDFNFRTLLKAIDFVTYNKDVAGTLFEHTTPVDEQKAAYIAIKSKKMRSTLQEIQVWTEITGQSRATYFRVKREVEKEYVH